MKPDNVATFWGKKLHGHYQDEMGHRDNIRIQGTRIKHTTGPVSIKLCDKFGLILRIETTVNDVSFSSTTATFGAGIEDDQSADVGRGDSGGIVSRLRNIRSRSLSRYK